MMWKPTLAATLPVDADLSKLPYPLWVSPKYDGRRALVQGGKLVSRNGLVIPNRSACEPIEALDLEGFDGELVVGNATAVGVRDRTSSYLSTRGYVETDEVGLREPVTYFVFDYFAKHSKWTRDERLATLMPGGAERFNVIDKWTRVVVVRQQLISNAKMLTAYEQKIVGQGHEGVMLRPANRKEFVAYMQKRSTLKEFELVKWKRWEHGEAVILAVHPLEHNQNTEKTASGRKSTRKASMVQDAKLFGSATLRDVKTRVEFSVQIPGTKLQAWESWEDFYKRYKSVRRMKVAQARVTYKYQPGANGIPIHPTCAFTELGVE